MTRVEMRPAFQWTCDECGKEHFAAARIIELSEDERFEYAVKMGLIEEWDGESFDDLEGDLLTCPPEVTCPNCGSTFETQHYSDDID